MAERVLLTALGIDPKEVTYLYRGARICETSFSTVAVTKLLKERPTRVIVLCTPQAVQHFPAFQKEMMEKAGGPVPDAPLDVEEVRTEAEFWQVFTRVAEELKGAAEVVLDVTGGFRSIPLIFFAATAFRRATDNLTVRGVYYGLLSRGSSQAPIVDLTPLWFALEGYFATRVFAHSGDPNPAVDLLRRLADLYVSRGEASGRLTKAMDKLGRVAAPLLAGLPLESGLAMGRALAGVSKVDIPAGGAFAPFREILQRMTSELQPFVLQAQEKAKVELTKDELKRELEMICWYLDRGHVPTALMLMREWVVNRVLLARKASDWLDRQQRIALAEGPLKRLRRLNPDAPLARLWRSLNNYRNPHAHGGFTPDEIGDTVRPAREVYETLCEHFDDDAFWEIDRRPVTVGSLLVAPLGNSPGPLFTALRRLRPDRLLIVTSKNAKASPTEVLQRAGCPNLPHRILALSDPFAGFTEAKQVARSVDDELVSAARVYISLTGGTTLLQFAVEQIGRRAAFLGVPVSRKAMVDRRPLEEQQQDPYVEGEVICLDDEQPGEEDEDQ